MKTWKYNSTDKWKVEDDKITEETPLEIIIEHGSDIEKEHTTLSITMRTPGEDRALAIGFLLSENIIQSIDDIQNIDHIKTHDTIDENRIKAVINPTKKVDPDKLKRHFYTTSSCGICSKTSIDQVMLSHPTIFKKGRPQFSGKELLNLPDRMQEVQNTFQSTGSIHATAIFDKNGKLLIIQEDVGRHNAMDKVIGKIVENPGINPQECIALVSGRASFELVQKAIAAEIPILAAIGAPSTLAVNLARDYGMTLVGFLRNGRFNVYADSKRISSAEL